MNGHGQVKCLLNWPRKYVRPSVDAKTKSIANRRRGRSLANLRGSGEEIDIWVIRELFLVIATKVFGLCGLAVVPGTMNYEALDHFSA